MAMPRASSEHSTHVAATVGGSGANSAAQGGTALQWRRMATNVDLISYGYQWNGVGMLFYQQPGDIESNWARRAKHLWSRSRHGQPQFPTFTRTIR